MTQAVSTHNTSFHSVEHDRQSVPDPDRVAYFEKAGWQAYYDRKWLRVLRLMVQLNREQFGMSLLTAIAAAVDVVRASLAFAPVDNDVPAATEHLRHFYEKAGRSGSLRADAQALAALEMDYWVVHRQLAVERRQAPDHTGDIEFDGGVAGSPTCCAVRRTPGGNSSLSRTAGTGGQGSGSHHRVLFNRRGRRLAACRRSPTGSL